MFIPRQNRNISTKWVKYAEPPGGQSSTEPPNFFIDYDVFQLVLQHIQKRKNLWGWPWNDGTSLKGNSAKKKVFLELFLEFSMNFFKIFGEKIKLIAE